MKQFKLNINTKTQKYPIIIGGNNLLNNLHKLLKHNSLYFNKYLIVIDNKIKKNLISKFLKNLKKKNIIIFF